MKTASVVALVLFLVLSGCDAPNPDSIGLTLEEVGVDAALIARIEEIKKLDDAAALYQIVKNDGMFTDTGKAANARLIEVLAPKIKGLEARELRDLEEKFSPLPGLTLNTLFSRREEELKRELNSKIND